MAGSVELPEFAGAVRAAFGLAAFDRLTPVSRGAMGWAWRAEVGGRRLCVKHFFEPPDLAALPHEIAFASLAVAHGIDAPVSLPSRDGDFAVAVAHGGTPQWVRLYTWCDGDPLPDHGRAGEVAELLAALHRIELHGPAPHPWYDTVPSSGCWERLAATATARGLRWAPALSARHADLMALSELVQPLPAAPRQTCHLDVQQANVLAGRAGRLALIDWGDAGTGNPDRELAAVMLSWTGSGPAGQQRARRFYDRYLAAGGPGRLSADAVLSMHVATRLNYVHAQFEASLGTDGDGAGYAAREASATLAALPAASDLLARQREWGTW